jgi:hypothetical protein
MDPRPIAPDRLVAMMLVTAQVISPGAQARIPRSIISTLQATPAEQATLGEATAAGAAMEAAAAIAAAEEAINNSLQPPAFQAAALDILDSF